MSAQKIYSIFAGVNGAGKSTLYQSTHVILPEDQPRVNADELTRDIGDPNISANQLQGGKRAVALLNDCLAKGVSFNQETTLCGHAILKNIKNAKEMGYQIELFYVGVKSAALAKERIAHRVTTGGHNIDGTLVERRYLESLQNLERVYPYCDKLLLFDNSEDFAYIARMEYGQITRYTPSLPDWARGVVDLAKQIAQLETKRKLAEALASLKEMEASTPEADALER